MLICVAITGDRNVIKREAEKILKYKDRITEIQRMWNVKAEVISVMTGRLEQFQNLSDSTRATYRKARN